MNKWLEFDQTTEGTFIDLSQFKKSQATQEMFCRCCEKIVKAYPPSACLPNKRADGNRLIAPSWLALRSFCSKCGWMYKKVKVPAIVKRAVLALDGEQCVYCGMGNRVGYPLEFDHRVPETMGGANTVENIVCACYECNMAKGNKGDWTEPKFGRFGK